MLLKIEYIQSRRLKVNLFLRLLCYRRAKSRHVRCVRSSYGSANLSSTFHEISILIAFAWIRAGYRERNGSNLHFSANRQIFVQRMYNSIGNYAKPDYSLSRIFIVLSFAKRD